MRKRRTQPASVSPSGPVIPAPGTGKRGESGYLGYLLRQGSAAHRLRMERALAEFHVTPAQFVVLTMLRAYPGISSADLARLALLTPQTVSVIVANLERAGSVVRRAHSVHGRIQHLDVTSAGQKLLAKCRECAHAIERRMRANLSPDEEQIVRRWLVSLATDGDQSERGES
jgi:DNA-binding MarR family transcriptional regulator